MFSTLAGLQPIFELGFTPTFVRAIAYGFGGAVGLSAIDDGNKQESKTWRDSDEFVNAICATMKWLYARIAIVAVLVLAIAGSIALSAPIKQVSAPQQAWAAWAVTLVSCFIAIRNTWCSAYLQGSNQIARLRRVEIMTILTSSSLGALTLLGGGGLLQVAIAFQSCNIAGAEWTRTLCRRDRPSAFRRNYVEPCRYLLKALWRPAWRSALGTAMSQGVVQVSAILYARLASAAEAAALLFSLRILQILISACQAPFYTKIPAMAHLYAQGNRSELLKIAARGMMMSYWIYAVGVISIGLLLQPILDAIGSRTAFIETSLWYAIGIAYLVERYGAMHLQLYSLSNDIIWHRANGIAGIIYLVVLWSLFPRFRLYAFPIGVLAGYLGFYSWYSARHSYRWYGLSFWRLDGRAAVAPGAILTIFFVLSAWFGLGK